MTITQEVLQKLKATAQIVRKDILTMLYHAGSGHPGGALSSVEIVTTLYFNEMRVRSEEPDWNNRDFFVLSKGHSCPVVYAALAGKGFFSKSWYTRLRHIDGELQGHPDRYKTPGIEFNSGSLSQGFSFALGRALAYKYQKHDNRVYVLMGCGEQDEGQVWEGAMFGAHYQLDNTVVFIDYNNLQSDDTNDAIMKIAPLAEKWRSFGWHAIEIDGHDFRQINDALETARQTPKMPTVVIARTVKGKGVSFMENVPKWHGSLAPTKEELETALAEIERNS